MRLRHTLAAAAIAALGLSARANAADTFQVDPVHSSVEYRVKHMNVSVSIGRFDNVSGTFTLDPADPAKGKFDFTIKTDSIDSGNPQRDGHLKGPDFLNAKQYPTITFKSKSVASAGKDAYDVRGDLTLHGVTKEVTLKVEQTGTGPGMRPGSTLIGLLSEFTIKRSDYGMKGMLQAVGDDIKVTVAVEAGKK